MSRTLKFIIGLVAVLLMGWLYHGPMGHGEALIGALEAQAQAAVAKTEVPGVCVALGHDPLSRTATLTGPADRSSATARASSRGSTRSSARSRALPACSGRRRRPRQATSIPLLAETLLMIALAYLVGIAIGRLAFGRPRSMAIIETPSEGPASS